MLDQVMYKYELSDIEVTLVVQGLHVLVKTMGINIDRRVFPLSDKIRAPFNKSTAVEKDTDKKKAVKTGTSKQRVKEVFNGNKKS
jgi:hypothetical protein